MSIFFKNFSPYKLPVLENGVKLPDFKIEKIHLDRLGLSDPNDYYNFLKTLTYEGLNNKIKKDNPRYSEYINRIEYELNTLNELGFCSYLLITWDIINYCKQNDIPTGAGRGSCCGSLVLFLIGVTEIDSVENGLFFERFLSKSRAKITLVDGVKYYDGGLLMDIDLDIGFSKRKLLTDWLENKYNGKISKLLTTSTYSTKILIKEVCKSYLDYNEDSASAISDLIPKLFGRTFTLEETLKDSKEFQKFASENPDAVNIGKNLHSLMSHFGVHASAWVITSEPINEIFPLQLTKERELVTSYSMEDASNLAIKCDILGLRCCTLIDETCKMIGLKPSDIDTKDEEIYKNLQNLESRHGIFQIEADLGFRTTQKVKPKDFNQLGAILALARPGSMAFADDYAEYSNNGKIPDFDIESDKLKKIMSETGGIIIYQETLMQIAKEVFGLSLDDAEQIRRACGKKKVEDMNKYKDIIYNKGQKLGIPKSAKFYWDVLIASADYSFNKCADISSLVEKSNGEKTMLKDVKIGDFIKAFDVKSNDDNYVEVVGIIHGKELLYEVLTESGKKIKVSLNHKFLCEDKVMRPLKEVVIKKYKIITE